MKEYDLSQQELKAIQRIQLEMLQEVDRICRKCGIHYNIIAGTLLGAVRHKGYIPWDDDADVALLREEYDKFCDACKTELDTSKYYFQDHNATKGYRWGYGKLRRKDTLFLRENQQHMPYEQGIFIDIFPLDNVPMNKIKRGLHNFHCFCIRKTMWSSVGKLSDKSRFKRWCYWILDKISEERLFEHYDRFIKKSNAKDSQWVRILTYPTPTKDFGYRKAWYEVSKEISFEGVSLYGIKEWEEYLSFKFGDFWTLPEEKDRKIHPITALQLPDNHN